MPSPKTSKYSKSKVEQYVKQQTGRRLAFGFEHAQRVYKLAKKLGSKYDDEILHAASFLHDLAQGKNHQDLSAKQAALLLKHDMSAPDMFRIQKAIRNHGVLGEPKGVEGILVHDAALLDALGGVGLLQLAINAKENNKTSLGEVVKLIRNYRIAIANKLILKQSKSLAADRLGVMDLVLDALETEL